MEIDTNIDILPECEVLGSFEEQDRRALTSYGEFLAFKPEQTVIREGQSQESLYFLVQGLLHAVHVVKDGATPLGAIRDGEWFGEINIFDPQRASAMVVSRTNSLVWRISRNDLEAFLNDHSALGCLLLLGVGEVLARRTRAVTEKLNAAWELSW
jgi:CRP-like cAMP-binding protein